MWSFISWENLRSIFVIIPFILQQELANTKQQLEEGRQNIQELHDQNALLKTAQQGKYTYIINLLYRKTIEL